MPKPKEVQISNGEITAFVVESSVPQYEKRGWTVVDDGSSETGSPEPVDEPEGTTVVADSGQYSLIPDDEEE